MIEVKGIVPVWVALEYKPAPWIFITGDEVTSRYDFDWTEKRLSRSWFREVDPPYRRGVGIRLRIKIWAIHIGVMRRTKSKSEMDVLGYDLPGFDPAEIGKWRG